MNISISYSRKEGRANYGSEGAGCEISCELGDQQDPLRVAATLRELAKRAVDAALAGGEAAAPTPPAPQAGSELRQLGRDNGSERPRSGWKRALEAGAAAEEPGKERPRFAAGTRERAEGGGRRVSLGPPATGRQFFAWMQKQEEGDHPGIRKYMVEWARENRLPWKMGEWDSETTAEANREAEAWRSRN